MGENFTSSIFRNAFSFKKQSPEQTRPGAWTIKTFNYLTQQSLDTGGTKFGAAPEGHQQGFGVLLFPYHRLQHVSCRFVPSWSQDDPHTTPLKKGKGERWGPLLKLFLSGRKIFLIKLPFFPQFLSDARLSSHFTSSTVTILSSTKNRMTLDRKKARQALPRLSGTCFLNQQIRGESPFCRTEGKSPGFCSHYLTAPQVALNFNHLSIS